jgi:hypothetical protein
MEDRRSKQAPVRVAPRGGETRCPYCHDDCAPDGDVVVCRECLSRHHAGCWAESRACGSCQADRALAQAVEPAVTPRLDRLVAGLAALQLLSAVALFALVLPPIGEALTRLEVHVSPSNWRFLFGQPWLAFVAHAMPAPIAVCAQHLGLSRARALLTVGLGLLLVFATTVSVLMAFAGHG